MVTGFPNFPRVGDMGKVRETHHHPSPSPIFRGSCACAGCDLAPDRCSTCEDLTTKERGA